jgi:hypothetical protein
MFSRRLPLWISLFLLSVLSTFSVSAQQIPHLLVVTPNT